MPKQKENELQARNAAIYARYSSHNQSEQSIEGQLRDAYDFARREGYNIVGEYIDRAVSGKTDDRPDFQRMLADAPKHQFQYVLVWKLDRFARNRMEAAFNRQKLSKHGIKLISVKENISDAPEGIIMEGLLESMAEYYSANLSQNVKRGKRETYMKGLYGGGTTPFGYKEVDGKLLQDELTAPIVREIFERYVAGERKAIILRDLKARGVKTTRGVDMDSCGCLRILSNPIYCGIVVRGGIEIDCVPDPIVSKELFDKAQILIQAHRHAPAAAKAKEPYLLQGKVFCGLCGSAMLGGSSTRANQQRYRYYTCSARKKDHDCAKKNEKKEMLENIVVRETVRFISSPKNLDKASQGVMAAYEKEFGQGQLKELEKKKDRLEADLNNVVEAIAKTPGKGQARLLEKLDRLEAQKDDLETDIAKLKIAQEVCVTEKDIKSWLKQFAAGDPDYPEFRQWLIDTLVNSVYLFENYMVIFFNIRGTKKICFTDVQKKLMDDKKMLTTLTFSENAGHSFSVHCSDLESSTRELACSYPSIWRNQVCSPFSQRSPGWVPGWGRGGEEPHEGAELETAKASNVSFPGSSGQPL